MNAKLYSRTWVNEWGSDVTSNFLVIEEESNLAITVYQGTVFAETDYEFDEEDQELGDVDVPDDLLSVTLDFVEANHRLQEQRSAFDELLE